MIESLNKATESGEAVTVARRIGARLSLVNKPNSKRTSCGPSRTTVPCITLPAPKRRPEWRRRREARRRWRRSLPGRGWCRVYSADLADGVEVRADREDEIPAESVEPGIRNARRQREHRDARGRRQDFGPRRMKREPRACCSRHQNGGRESALPTG